MTIKQQGGIFGRNPSFNDLTAETVDINGGTIDDVAANSLSALSTDDASGADQFFPRGWSLLPAEDITVTIAGDKLANHTVAVDLGDFQTGNYVLWRMTVGFFRNQSGGYDDTSHGVLGGTVVSRSSSTDTHVAYSLNGTEGLTVNSVTVDTSMVVTFDLTTSQQGFVAYALFEYYSTDNTDAR
tara:strand:- start:216 stop:767 length:552 start_codon:yes stop_codon:yes gene_type:complete